MGLAFDMIKNNKKKIAAIILAGLGLLSAKHLGLELDCKVAEVVDAAQK